MRSLLATGCAAALFLAGSLAVAQKSDSAQVKQNKTTEAQSQISKTKSDTVYGKVEAYQPGKSIKVSVPGKIVKHKTFELNEKNQTVNVASNVKVGDWVRIRQTKENNGHKMLTVKESAKPPKNG
jgi:ribosomal protein S17